MVEREKWIVQGDVDIQAWGLKNHGNRWRFWQGRMIEEAIADSRT